RCHRAFRAGERTGRRRGARAGIGRSQRRRVGAKLRATRAEGHPSELVALNGLIPGHRVPGSWPPRSHTQPLPEATVMATDELAPVRALLTSKPRPTGWSERRQRSDEVGSVWPVADDITLAPVDMEGVPGEWSMAPGCNADRVLVFFHGGGYCAGSIRSHRRMVTEAGRAGAVRTLAVGYRLAPEHPFPAALMDALTAWH